MKMIYQKKNMKDMVGAVVQEEDGAMIPKKNMKDMVGVVVVQEVDGMKSNKKEMSPLIPNKTIQATGNNQNKNKSLLQMHLINLIIKKTRTLQKKNLGTFLILEKTHLTTNINQIPQDSRILISTLIILVVLIIMILEISKSLSQNLAITKWTLIPNLFPIIHKRQ